MRRLPQTSAIGHLTAQRSTWLKLIRDTVSGQERWTRPLTEILSHVDKKVTEHSLLTIVVEATCSHSATVLGVRISMVTMTSQQLTNHSACRQSPELRLSM